MMRLQVSVSMWGASLLGLISLNRAAINFVVIGPFYHGPFRNSIGAMPICRLYFSLIAGRIFVNACEHKSLNS